MDQSRARLRRAGRLTVFLLQLSALVLGAKIANTTGSWNVRHLHVT
jgi:hypothetical protein